MLRQHYSIDASNGHGMVSVMHLVLAAPDHPLRPTIQRAIADVYSREYGVKVPAFPRLLGGLYDGGGALLAAAGVRQPEDGFFSEIYLDQPVEAAISTFLPSAPARSQIIEIGAMAGIKPANSLVLVDMLARRFMATGARWAFFTATRRLRALLGRSGIPLIDLGCAESRRVANPQDWGTYYMHDPRVVAVEGAVLPRFLRSMAPTQEASHA